MDGEGRGLTSATFELTVPGDVEVRSGAHVVRREVDKAAGVTRFELLPPEGDALHGNFVSLRDDLRWAIAERVVAAAMSTLRLVASGRAS